MSHLSCKEVWDVPAWEHILSATRKKFKHVSSCVLPTKVKEGGKRKMTFSCEGTLMETRNRSSVIWLSVRRKAWSQMSVTLKSQLKCHVSSNKCHASSNKCHASSNKKLLGSNVFSQNLRLRRCWLHSCFLVELLNCLSMWESTCNRVISCRSQIPKKRVLADVTWAAPASRILTRSGHIVDSPKSSAPPDMFAMLFGHETSWASVA